MGIIGTISGDGVVGGVSNFGASIVNAISANKQIEQQYQNQKALYQQQFEQQRQLIQEQNEYNSYANQRKLMEEAGLNPALMYQNGTSGALQSEVANPQVPQAPLKQGAGMMIASGVDKGIQTMMSLAQLDLLEAQTQQAQEAANKQRLESLGIGIDNEYKGRNYEAGLQKTKYESLNLRENIRKTLSDIDLNSSVIGLNRTAASLNEARVNDILSQISYRDRQRINAELEAAGIVANNRLIAARAVNEETSRQLIALDIALKKVEFKYSDAIAYETLGEKKISNQSARLDALYKQWRQDYIMTFGYEPATNKEDFVKDLLRGSTKEASILSLKYGSEPRIGSPMSLNRVGQFYVP